MSLNPTLRWWLLSDQGLAARILIGISIFTLLAVIDLQKNGARARRWREYVFLAATTVLGIAYGAANDWITASISWEYFYFGKGLADQLGPATPPDFLRLHLAAMAIGAKAAGAAGIVVGAILLLANNPRRDVPALQFPRLFAIACFVFGVTAMFAALFGVAGWLGMLTWVSSDLRGIVQEHLFRPGHFLCAFGVHLGGYVGGLLGTVTALLLIARERRRGS